MNELTINLGYEYTIASSNWNTFGGLILRNRWYIHLSHGKANRYHNIWEHVTEFDQYLDVVYNE